jgi:predicted HTH transcriptional regulator
MIVESQNKPKEQTEDPAAEEVKTWDNPVNPEKAEDARDVEQMKRKLKEAERRKENLTDDKN